MFSPAPLAMSMRVPSPLSITRTQAVVMVAPVKPVQLTSLVASGSRTLTAVIRAVLPPTE